MKWCSVVMKINICNSCAIYVFIYKNYLSNLPVHEEQNNFPTNAGDQVIIFNAIDGLNPQKFPIF